MATFSLLRQGHALASADVQKTILEGPHSAAFPSFEDRLADADCSPLRANGIDVLQVNVGKVCNQTCAHCHVDAGPDRRERMSWETMQACLDVLRRTSISTLDITGGAPEMHPRFRDFVTAARQLGRHVIDRCNLTILLATGFEDLAEFLADQQVEIVASLPCYLAANCDRQRGEGVFEKSVTAIQRLNAVGYGKPETGLTLNLVYNPVGPSLPPAQASLEGDYRRELHSRYGIEFTRLYTITNMPISRFLQDLLDSGRYDAYLAKLIQAFNPLAVEGLMCRKMISVDWRGVLYDCDFNQMLKLGVNPVSPQTIQDFQAERLERRIITTGRHCFGCTAGAGSSCQGRIV